MKFSLNKKAKIPCIRGRMVFVGEGLFKSVFRVGPMVVKAYKGRYAGKNPLVEPKQLDARIREAHEKFSFFPRYYGMVVGYVERGGKKQVTPLTFHEYVKPLRYRSIQEFRKVLNFIMEVAEKGYVLDVKMPNFGIKGGKLYYLDEMGLGNGVFPPDLLEHLLSFFRFPKKKGITPA
ncbi:MAG: hypothetical protein QXF20_00755 [Candidatus Hadarchaeales archaeon]